MKWIIAVVVILGSLFFYGVIKAKSQLSDGVSLFQVAATYNSLNPVSQYGYQWVMKNDSGVNNAVIKMNKAFDDLKSP